MGEQKPIFAIDLSNEGVALWHRKGSAGWVALGQLALSDPDFERRLIEMRDRAPVRGRATVIRIPRTEVMLTKVRLGVFEGEAALSHARKQVAELTPYSLDEVAYDLGEKGFGNMAPVGVVARSTLVEAETFARSHGFDPIYFTTQYGEREFPREPRFYLQEPKPMPAILGWVVPWAAAAAIGLTAGFLGYSWLSAPGEAVTTALDRAAAPAAVEATAPVEGSVTPQPTPDPQDETDVAALDTRSLDAAALPDVAPRLPPVAANLLRVGETAYPEILTEPVGRLATFDAPGQLRLVNLRADEPTLVAKSGNDKTNSLRIVEARRDLPDVNVDETVVGLLQDSMASAVPTIVDNEDNLVQIARLTAPTVLSDAVAFDPLPPTGESKAQVSESVTALPDPPPPPVSLVVAEPGTLTPTVEGTLGPGNILIFAGRPRNPPPARAGSEIPPDPLAGFPPRLRPEGLVPAEVLAERQRQLAADQGDLLALADAALRPFRARPRPDGLAPALEEPGTPSEAPTTLALAETDDVTDGGAVTPETDTAIASQPAPAATQVAEADQTPTTSDTVEPSAPTETAQTTDAGTDTVDLADATAETTNDQQPAPNPEIDVFAASDPALRPLRARVRPNGLNTAVGGIFAQADPTLRSARARPRPPTLRVPAPEPTASEDVPVAPTQEISPGDALLAAADPALRTATPRNRPTTLRVPQSVVTAVAETDADTTPATDIDAAVADAVAGDQTAAARGDALLAAADPTLAGLRARSRPGTLNTSAAASNVGLLALADPALRGKRAKSRPGKLRILARATDSAPTAGDTLASATRQAVASSPMPKTRPGKISRVAARVQRLAAAEAKDTRATASTPSSAKGSSKPSPGPTAVNVANTATEKARFSKSRISLVGVFGAASSRRALVRLPTGRYVKVKAGDRVSGWKVSAIGESSLRISKGSRNQTLRVP